MRWLAVSVRWHENSFVTKALPFCHERFAASTSKTGTTGEIVGETFTISLGNGMVPNSQRWQTFLTMCPWKAEQFTLNSRQTYDSMWAIVPGKAQDVLLVAINNGVQSLVWERETFAYADGWDAIRNRYRSLRAGQSISVALNADSVLVKPEVAAQQLATEQAPPAQPVAPTVPYTTGQARSNLLLGESGDAIPSFV